MKTATEELTGNALIWAVCHALKLAPVVAKTGVAYRSEHGSWVYPRYTDDSEAGVLMASEWIGVERPSNGQTPPQWRAVTDNKTAPDSMRFNPVVSAWGASLGMAVCRALVLSRIGKTVDVPDELMARKSA